MPEFYTERQSHWENHLSMLFDPITGEAIAINGVGDGKQIYIPTGFFFERVIQMQLDENGRPLDGTGTWAKAQPWGWATEQTAQKVLALLAKALPDVQLTLGKGDVNERFPFFYPDGKLAYQAEIRVKNGDGVVVRQNAGLLAMTFARYVTIDPATGKARRSTMPVRCAATEIEYQLAAKQV